MNTRTVILVCCVLAPLFCGCTSTAQSSKDSGALHSPPVRQHSVLAIPSSINGDMAQETGIPAIASSGILSTRNMAVLGKAPIAVPNTLRAERVLRDTQWISSGRPYDNLRYSVRVKSRFAP